VRHFYRALVSDLGIYVLSFFRVSRFLRNIRDLLPLKFHYTFLIILKIIEISSHLLPFLDCDERCHIFVRENVKTLNEIIHILSKGIFPLLDNLVRHALQLLGRELWQLTVLRVLSDTSSFEERLMQVVELAVSLLYFPTSVLCLHSQRIKCVFVALLRCI